MSTHHMIETSNGVLRLHCAGRTVETADLDVAGVTGDVVDLGYCGGHHHSHPCPVCIDEAIEWERQDRKLRARAWRGTNDIEWYPFISEGDRAAYCLEVQALRRRMLANHRSNRPALARGGVR